MSDPCNEVTLLNCGCQNGPSPGKLMTSAGLIDCPSCASPRPWHVVSSGGRVVGSAEGPFPGHDLTDEQRADVVAAARAARVSESPLEPRRIQPLTGEEEREINSGLPADCEIDVEHWGVGIKVCQGKCGGEYHCDTSTYLERDDLVAMLAALDKAEATGRG